jgi:hypothetical protein
MADASGATRSLTGSRGDGGPASEVGVDAEQIREEREEQGGR